MELGRLVKWVEGRTRRCTDLDRLSLAVKIGTHLEAVREDLIGHFVEQARASGASWTQVGERLGVTKQAAQQRHVTRKRLLRHRRGRREREMVGPFGRFTGWARTAVTLAQEEARRLDHDYVGTEHLLLGLLAEGQGVAGTVLATFGVSLDMARTRVEEIVGRGSGAPAGPMRFTPRAKKVLQLAVNQARHLSHKYLGTEHLLLALAREREGIAAMILLESGMDYRTTREAVVKELSSRSDSPDAG